MSKYQEEFHVHLSLEDCMIACREAVAGLGWRVLEQSGKRLVCKELAPQGMSFTWAAQVETLLDGESPDKTRVTLKGSIFGLGPIQSGHLKGQVGNFRNRIELASVKRSKAAGETSTSLASELKKLAELHSQGAISDDEYNQAKARLLSK